MTDRWYVKLARGGWETVMASSTIKAEAEALANECNTRYQTDEYWVEAYDPAKAWSCVREKLILNMDGIQ